MSRRRTPLRECLAMGIGVPTKLCFAGHVMMENRHDLVVDATVTKAHGTAEREPAPQMLGRQPAPRATVGADNACDTKDFIANARALGVMRRA